jgi:nitroreductase
MRDFLELVNRRYSCRDFSDKKVEKEKLLKCVEAARLAPSACNSQPWKFIIIDDPELKKKVTDGAYSGAYSASWAKKAPVLVVVISEKGNFISSVGSMIRDTRYYLINIGIAVEHFVLQATELGLGTCWMGWFNESGVKKALGLPKSAKVDVILPVGYPAKQEERKKTRKTTEDISKFNKI